MKESKKNLLVISLILLIIVIDQTLKIYIIRDLFNSSKIIIKNFLSLTYIENTGGAYGLGQNNTILFIIINILIIGVLFALVFVKKKELNNFILIAISLIIAGGTANLIDRIFRGYVVDYIDINQLFKYPIFNFADICIVIGTILVIIDLIFCKKNSLSTIYRSKNERI